MMQQTWIPSQPGKINPGNGVVGSSQTIVRILKVIYILYSLEAGIFLVLLPWMAFWDTNYLTYSYPQISSIISNPFFKGAVFGLGIVNIAIGISEIARFKKFSKGVFYT